MSLGDSVRQALNAVLSRVGVELVGRRSLERLRAEGYVFSEAEGRRHGEAVRGSVPALPFEAHELVELRRRYEPWDEIFGPGPIWTEGHLAADDLRWFRGDNAWVWQARERNAAAVHHVLTALYLESIDRLGLMRALSEDGAFGASVFDYRGRPVSRDLLDSVAELNLLERTLGLSSMERPCILDIGAGYGRLASRAVAGLPFPTDWLCTDGIAESTLVSRFYLGFRGVIPAAQVVPLDEVDEALGRRRVDVAVNIHSFSECAPAAIRWWVELAARNRIRYLVIRPNDPDPTMPRLHTNDGLDFTPIVTGAGYALRSVEPKYPDETMQRHCLAPGYYFVFELRS